MLRNDGYLDETKSLDNLQRFVNFFNESQRNFSALSCSLFIPLLSVLLWSIQTNVQYPDCGSIKAVMITLNLSLLV